MILTGLVTLWSPAAAWPQTWTTGASAPLTPSPLRRAGSSQDCLCCLSAEVPRRHWPLGHGSSTRQGAVPEPLRAWGGKEGCAVCAEVRVGPSCQHLRSIHSQSPSRFYWLFAKMAAETHSFVYCASYGLCPRLTLLSPPCDWVLLHSQDPL